MSLFPTQYGNVFGGSNTAGRTELVAFNAGKMDVRQTANGKFLVSPDLKKGKICLTRGDDQLVHFQWVDRQTGAAPEDFIMFPDDATFSRVNTGREGDRVYLLQYKNSARRFFFWMQHKDSSRDEELAKKVNDFMNNVQPSGGSEPGRGGAGNVQLDHNAIMQMLGAMGAGGEQGRGGAGANSNVQVSDLQNILQNMGLPASQTNASPATSAASSSHTSHSGGASSVAATTASTHEHDVGGMEMDEMTEEELLRLAIEESMRDVQSDSAAPAPAPTAAPPAASQVPFAPAPPAAPRAALLPPPGAPSAAPGMITAADLERAMASIQAFAQPKSISLKKLLSPENVASLLNDETAVRALVQHLPEGVQNAHELQATLHSPQLRQSIGSLVNALQSGNFNAVLANFGLDASAGASKLAVGDSIGAFLDAIQHWTNQQDSNMADQSS